MSRTVTGGLDGEVAPGRRERLLSGLGAFALVVVVVAPAAASWHALVGFGVSLGLTSGWPLVVPLVLDGAALYAAVLSLRAVLAGDSAVGSRLLVAGYAVASAGFNWYHAQQTGGMAAALFFAGSSVSAVLLWDRTLKALRRDQLRELGVLERPLPRFRVLRWLLAPSETFRAYRIAVLHGVSTPADALRLARWTRLGLDVEELPIPSPRVALAIPVAELEGLSKAEALRTAWRALGVEGVPGTGDVVPAMGWLADRGVVVDRSRAYEVRRRMLSEYAASTRSALSVVGDR